MKNYEAFLEIRKKISEDERRILELEGGELNLKQRSQAQLDEKAHRAWALDEPNADKLKATAQENEKAVFRIEEELKKLKKRVELMKKDNVPAQEAALADLRAYYRKAAEPLVMELAKRLGAAAEIEAEIIRLDKEAAQKGYQVTSYPRIIMPPIVRCLLPQEGKFRDGYLGGFLRCLKQDGFEIGDVDENFRLEEKRVYPDLK